MQNKVNEIIDMSVKIKLEFILVHCFLSIQINEAFASQYLAVEKELDLDRELTNVHGGAIAIGHPVGASGSRILAHLAHRLATSNGGSGRRAIGSACIGGGQGIAVMIESI